ncbi:MAG: response regulator [Acidaminococcaceae bacterium]|nr:response regulator [Acidaminococcaceae bacterium]
MKEKLLLVDNVVERRAKLKRFLAKDYIILEADDGCQGLEILEQDRKIKIVLLELLLPKMSGLEFLQIIRRKTIYKKMIVIVVTSVGEPSDEITALGIGADDYICKPFTLEVVSERIKNALTNKEILADAESNFCLQGNILDETATAIYVVDAVNYNLFYTNKAAMQLMNCTNKNYSGKKCYEFFGNGTHPCKFCKLVITHTDNNKAEIYIPFINKTVQVRVCMMKWLGRPAYITYMTDTTEQKRARELADARYKKELQRRCRVDLDFMAYLIFNVTTGMVVEHDPHGFPVPTLVPGQPATDFSERVLPTVVDFGKRCEFADMLKLDNLKKSYDAGITLRSIDYRRYSRNGKYIMWARSTIQLMKDPHSGDLTGFLYTYDINETKMMQEIISAAVHYDYDMIAYINLSTETTKLYAQNDQRFSLFIGREFGYDKVVAEYVKIFIAAKERSDIRENMSIDNVRSKLKENDIYEFVVDIISADGVIKKKKLRYANFDKNYGMVLWTEVDITNIVEQQKLLLVALLAANNVNTIKTDYLASISHEMRMPFKNITACLRNVTDKNASDVVKEQLEEAKLYVSQLTEIVNDIMDISNLESKKMQIVNTQFFLTDIVWRLKNKFKHCYTLKRQNFIVEQQIFHDICFSDIKAISRILANILDNAFRYTDKGGNITLKLYELPSESNEKGVFRFVVKDDGPGIRPELLENIFVPFYCCIDGKCKSESSGLGLAISKGIVDELGGKIFVSSELGNGTIVTVDLVLLLKNPENHGLEVSEESSKSIVGMKILIVENEPLSVLVARRLLEKKGAQVYLAKDSSTALELVENINSASFDCVLLDVCSHGLNGVEVAKKLRHSSPLLSNEIPIIGFGEKLTHEEKHHCVKAGINDFLDKPLKFTELFEMVLNLCKNR